MELLLQKQTAMADVKENNTKKNAFLHQFYLPFSSLHRNLILRQNKTELKRS
ncbi:hypothetical protein YC2023_118221 [Brassica napus]